MSVSALASFCGIQLVHEDKFCLLMPRNNHLSNALSVVDDKVFGRHVHEQNTDFTAIIGIYRAGGIKHGDTVFESQTASRTHLSLVSRRQCNVQSGGYQTPFQRMQYHSPADIRPQVHSGTLFRGIRRQRLMTLVYDFYTYHCFNFNFTHACCGKPQLPYLELQM